MENDCPLPPPPSTTTTGSSKSSAVQSSIRALNKSSHKISKTHMQINQVPVTTSKPEHAGDETHQPPPSGTAAAPTPPQPPVYNINKNDFRDVVQKLTGSPAHHGSSAVASPSPPPPAAKPAAATASRLQKNRPPPLSQLGPRPPPLVSEMGTADGSGVGPAGAYLRPWLNTPLSPLPPLPAVSAAAESPITAYMRCLRGGPGGGPQAGTVGMPLFPLPTSPLGFGCLPSPQTAFQAMVPSSPRVPIPSPKWEEQ